MGESQDFSKLPWAHGEEQLRFYVKNDPTKIFSLVAEFHPDTGYFVLYTEWRYAEGYGGEVYQERSVEDIFRQHQAARERAEAQNEADAIGGP
jgi:hypothetical protein